MTTRTIKLTAEGELKQYARDNEWQIRNAGTTTVMVPNPSSPYGGMKPMTVRVVEFSGSPAGILERTMLIKVMFKESGAYHSAQVFQSGASYQNRPTKAKVIEYLTEDGPYATKARLARRAERDRESLAAQDAKVAAAYAKAKTDLFLAQGETFDALLAAGLTDAQATAVVVMAQEDGNPLAKLVGAKHAVDQSGKGYYPGWTSLRGTYENGVRVSD